MFIFDETTGQIVMHAGDTGSATYTVGGDTLSSNDRVVWAMKNSRGDLVRQEYLTPDANNEVTIEFENSDTDNLPAGKYQYDLRVVTNPTYGTGDDASTIVDGDDVTTLCDPIPIVIKSPVGKV